MLKATLSTSVFSLFISLTDCLHKTLLVNKTDNSRKRKKILNNSQGHKVYRRCQIIEEYVKKEKLSEQSEFFSFRIRYEYLTVEK